MVPAGDDGERVAPDIQEQYRAALAQCHDIGELIDLGEHGSQDPDDADDTNNTDGDANTDTDTDTTEHPVIEREPVAQAV